MSEASSSRNHLNSLIRFLRLRGPLAEDRMAQMLHVLVLALAVWYAAWSVILLPLYPDVVARVQVALVAEAAPVATLILLRVGRLKQACLVYLAATWLATTLRLALSGGIRSTSQVHYVTLPILAAWLLGYRAALWTAGICLASALTFAILQLAGVNFSHIVPVTPLATWSTLVQVTLIGAVPVAQILRTLRDTLAESSRRQDELREYKEDLERLVQERTAELVEARDQAVTANRAKSVFLANMSHELRTPLNAILGFSSLLREDRLTSRQREDLEIINRGGEHLLNLINDVLDMSKIDSGRVEIVSDSVNLPELVRHVADLMRMQANEKGLELVFEQLSVVPRFIRADAEKLRQVLINLLSNAIKYTEQGSVTLRLYATHAEPIVLTFEVEDTGIGIAAEDRIHIFDAFVQVGKQGRQNGSGLGLAITRQFVELMGGTIQVESTKDRGSRFAVTLSVEQAEGFETNRSESREGRVIGLKPGQPEYRILIVEDEPESRLLLQRMLQNAGFHVCVGENGAQGVEMFQSWQPHFIWMDWRMPVMGGAEATRRIRSLEGGTEVRIAAVTASAFASERLAVLAAGVDDFIRKPYRATEIFDCLGRHLQVHFRFARADSVPREQASSIRPEELEALPEELRAELVDALVRLDTNRVVRTIKCVQERDSALGSMLADWASRLAYSEILNAINSVQTTSVGQRA